MYGNILQFYNQYDKIDLYPVQKWILKQIYDLPSSEEEYLKIPEDWTLIDSEKEDHFYHFNDNDLEEYLRDQNRYHPTDSNYFIGIMGRIFGKSFLLKKIACWELLSSYENDEDISILFLSMNSHFCRSCEDSLGVFFLDYLDDQKDLEHYSSPGLSLSSVSSIQEINISTFNIFPLIGQEYDVILMDEFAFRDDLNEGLMRMRSSLNSDGRLVGFSSDSSEKPQSYIEDIGSRLNSSLLQMATWEGNPNLNSKNMYSTRLSSGRSLFLQRYLGRNLLP
jgi:hypothetical protein